MGGGSPLQRKEEEQEFKFQEAGESSEKTILFSIFNPPHFILFFVLPMATTGAGGGGYEGLTTASAMDVVGSSASTTQQQASGFLDLEALSSRYRGPGRIHRLLFIAEHSQSHRKRAIELAIDAIKSDTCNTGLYKQVISSCAPGELGPAYAFDEQWVVGRDKLAKQRRDALDKDYNAQSGQNRENIRVSIESVCECSS